MKIWRDIRSALAVNGSDENAAQDRMAEDHPAIDRPRPAQA
jgi:hypothetical protein